MINILDNGKMIKWMEQENIFFSTGSSYEGHWQNNLQQGDGIHIDKNGKVAKSTL